MKIGIITNTFGSHLFGGSNVYISNLAQELSKRRNNVFIVTAGQKKRDSIEEWQGIRVHRFHPRNVSTFYTVGKESVIKQAVWTLLDIYSTFSYNKIRSIVEQERPDVIHVHIPIDITLSIFRLLADLRIPSLFTSHDYLLLCRRIVLLHGSGRICTDKNVHPACRVYRRIARNISKHGPDVVIFPSQFAHDHLVSHGFFAASKKVVLPYGIRLESMRKSTSQTTKPSGFTLLYVGSLTRHKGVDVLINAFKSIEIDDARLSIVGDGVYRKSLEKLAEGDRRITFYGKVANQDLGRLYQDAHVLVVPSCWYEVLGIVIQEAFRAGLPVIGSDIGGIPELIKDGHNGFLVRAGDVTHLRDQAIFCYNHPEILATFSRRALDTVKRFDMETHLERLLDLYSEVIQRHQ